MFLKTNQGLGRTYRNKKGTKEQKQNQTKQNQKEEEEKKEPHFQRPAHWY